MSLLLTLTLSTAAVLLLRESIRKAPAVFYALCILTVSAGIYLILNPSPISALRELASILQKGYVAFSLFVLVMFIGVIPKSSKGGRRLLAIRSELSIMASILICAHFIPYLLNYASMLPFFTSLKTGAMISLALSFVLVLLLIPLAITSLKAVKNRMKPSAWKRLQRCAYVFFALIYFHAFGYLLAPLQEGSPEAMISIALYTVILASYLVLRIKKEFADRSQEDNGHHARTMSHIP